MHPPAALRRTLTVTIIPVTSASGAAAPGNLSYTQVTDAGCAALAAALSSGALPALKTLNLEGIPASDAAKAAVYEARANLGTLSEDDSESDDEEGN